MFAGSVVNEENGNVQKPGIFTLMKIGYTLDGEFDPDHDDFRWCWGKCHVHFSMKITSVLASIAAIMDLVDFILNPNSDILVILKHCIYYVIILIMLLSIIFWKKFYKLLNIYLFYLAISMLTNFGYIVYLFIVVLKMSSLATDAESRKAILNAQLIMLIQAIVDTLTLFFNVWSFYCVYVEYRLFSRSPAVDEENGNVVKKPGIFTLMKIGYTLDGEFDPNHEDFRGCCGKIHIHKIVIFITIISVLITIYDVVNFFLNPSTDTLLILRKCLTLFIVILLVISLTFWKKLYKLLKLYFLYLGISILIDFGYIVFLFIVVLKMSDTKNEDVSADKILNTQLSMLEEAVIVTLTLFFNAWSFYGLYVEYKYLKGRIKNGIF